MDPEAGGADGSHGGPVEDALTLELIIQLLKVKLCRVCLDGSEQYDRKEEVEHSHCTFFYLDDDDNDDDENDMEVDKKRYY